MEEKKNIRLFFPEQQNVECITDNNKSPGSQTQKDPHLLCCCMYTRSSSSTRNY